MRPSYLKQPKKITLAGGEFILAGLWLAHDRLWGTGGFVHSPDIVTTIEVPDEALAEVTIDGQKGAAALRAFIKRTAVKCFRCGSTEPEVASALLDDETCVPLCRPCCESAGSWFNFYARCGACGKVEERPVDDLRADGWTLPTYVEPEEPVTVEEMDALDEKFVNSRRCPGCSSPDLPEVEK
jgi:hypothetical protein